jgi:hypothetical protein
MLWMRSFMVYSNHGVGYFVGRIPLTFSNTTSKEALHQICRGYPYKLYIMKKILCLCLTAALSATAYSQTDSQLRELDSARKDLAFSGMVYPYIDSSPGYPEGDKKWSDYVTSANLMKETIAKAKEQKVPSGRYTVIVRFAVNADSTLSDIKPVGPKVGYGFEDAAIKLVQESGKWIPAHVEGKHIKSHLQLPVNFTITRTDN